MLRVATISERKNPAFIAFRQSHLKGYASTPIMFTAINENEKAGLIIFQNGTRYYFSGKSIQNNKPVVQLYKSPAKGGGADELGTSAYVSDKNLFLKIEASNDVYNFYYATKKNKWILLKDKVDGKFLSTKTAGGFVGSMFGLYATSNGAATNNVALYNWFEYKGDDDIYK